MPFQFVIDKDANLIHETWTGNVNLAEFKESSRQEWAHPDYHKDMNMLSDFSNCVVDISTEELWTFVSWFSQQESLGRHALVVSRDSSFGLAKMFSSLTQDQKHYSDSLRIFNDLAAAKEWLRAARA